MDLNIEVEFNSVNLIAKKHQIISKSFRFDRKTLPRMLIAIFNLEFIDGNSHAP